MAKLEVTTISLLWFPAGREGMKLVGTHAHTHTPSLDKPIHFIANSSIWLEHSYSIALHHNDMGGHNMT